jgi:hypothetical protein
MDKEQKEKRETPIIDGDARPDMPVDPQADESRHAPGESADQKEKKFTSERLSDLNSLEDQKDARQDK